MQRFLKMTRAIIASRRLTGSTLEVIQRMTFLSASGYIKETPTNLCSKKDFPREILCKGRTLPLQTWTTMDKKILSSQVGKVSMSSITKGNPSQVSVKMLVDGIN